MKNGRLFAVLAGVFLAVCLIFAVVMTAMYAPSAPLKIGIIVGIPVSYTHLRAHET